MTAPQPQQPPHQPQWGPTGAYAQQPAQPPFPPQPTFPPPPSPQRPSEGLVDRFLAFLRTPKGLLAAIVAAVLAATLTITVAVVGAKKAFGDEEPSGTPFTLTVGGVSITGSLAVPSGWQMRKDAGSGDYFLSPLSDSRSVDDLKSDSKNFNNETVGVRNPLALIGLTAVNCDEPQGVSDSADSVWSDGWWTRTESLTKNIDGYDYGLNRIYAVQTSRDLCPDGRRPVPEIIALDAASADTAPRTAVDAARNLLPTVHVNH